MVNYHTRWKWSVEGLNLRTLAKKSRRNLTCKDIVSLLFHVSQEFLSEWWLKGVLLSHVFTHVPTLLDEQ